MEKLELRMYGIVPYNISEIQKGIQFGHAVVEYGQMAKRFGVPQTETRQSSEGSTYRVTSYPPEGAEIEKAYEEWADYWKTFIILNGGTSNHSMNRYHDGEFQGTMEQHLAALEDAGIATATFYEPDLNDMLSAVVFIVDERVFNKKSYPDFGDWIMENHYSYLADNMTTSSKIERMRLDGRFDGAQGIEGKLFAEWSGIVGGAKNIFLRDYLKGFRLA